MKKYLKQLLGRIIIMIIYIILISLIFTVVPAILIWLFYGKNVIDVGHDLIDEVEYKFAE